MKAVNFGVGVDIESIGRFRKFESDRNSPFLKRVFTEKELGYCFSKRNAASHLAGRYTGKEAVTKALSSFCETDIDYKDIEILNNEKGVPKVSINSSCFDSLRIGLSLSHCEDRAIAFAVVKCQRLFHQSMTCGLKHAPVSGKVSEHAQKPLNQLNRMNIPPIYDGWFLTKSK